ncbi:MAG TPA: LamG-like jellyroll fold domain-containing protein, partial [Pyrinomonadaceae bacterium]|nr:LamG-like jellyroll fold domain-containing protein [Pyrinomonadaceae bacterium]
SVFKIGKVGQAFQFDGTALSQVNIADSPSLRPVSAVTVEAWIKPSSAGTGFQGVVFKGNTGSTGGQPYSLFVNGVNHQIVVRVGNDSTFEAFGSVAGIPANVYSHVAFTYDGTTIRIYINGVLDTSAASSIGNLAQADTNILRVGGLGGSFNFIGEADELGIYNRALTVDEIAAISNAGLAGKYKVQSTVPNNLTAWYPGDGNPNDIQGGNNATLENGATYGNGKVGQGFQFDGTDDQITIPHNANQNGGTNLTLEAWINPTTLLHGGTIIQKRTSGNIGGYVFETTQPPTSAPNGLHFVIMIGGTYQILNPANVLTTNTWQHVVATYDGAFMRIYVNGVEVGSRAQTGAIDNSTAPVVIGRNVVNPSLAFQGGIDEPALYNRALSAAEIRDQFYAGSGGKYKLATNPAVLNITKTGEATVTFGSITTAGAVHQTPLNPGLLPPLPMGTNTGLDFDISTSANYTNPTVCLNLPTFTPAQFANLRIYHLESGVWQNRTAGSNAYPNLCTAALTSLSPFAVASVAPSAANVSLSGHVVAGKSGLNNVTVTLSGGSLPQPISARTNNFGYYQFNNLPVGETYVLTVSSKRYVFTEPSRIVNLLDSVTDADFTAETP